MATPQRGERDLNGEVPKPIKRKHMAEGEVRRPGSGGFGAGRKACSRATWRPQRNLRATDYRSLMRLVTLPGRVNRATGARDYSLSEDTSNALLV